MRVFDFSFGDPAENLAFDEVLLENAEAAGSGECLRFWESPVPFVVLGLTQSVRDHVHVGACESDGVSIQRRCTAGGCVVQAPGCLNFAFVLRTNRDGCDTIHGSYRAILGWIAQALAAAGADVSLAGISDLALGPHKVSGNAQKRKRLYFLHHGTLLYDFDAAACSRYLIEPPDRPEYRAQRSHSEFIRNLQLTRAALVEGVSGVFREAIKVQPTPAELTSSTVIAAQKYRVHEWVYKR